MTSKIHFTERTLKGLKHKEEGSNFYTDRSGRPPGFGLKVGKTKKTWRLFYRDKQGKQINQKIGDFQFLDLSPAREEAWKILEVKENGEPEKTEEPKTFKFLVDEYLEHHSKPNKSLNSYKEDKSRCENILSVWNDLPFDEIKRTDVVSIFDKVKKERGACSANRIISLISVIFNKGYKRGLVELNPAARFGKTKEAPRNRVLNDEEIKRVWNTIEELPNEYDPIFRFYLKSLFLTGQRKGETKEAEWRLVDLDGCEWKKEETKNGLVHTLPIVGGFKEILESLEKKSKWVFPSPQNPDECIVSHYKAFNWVKKEAGLDNFRTHCKGRSNTASGGGPIVRHLG